MMRQEGHSSLKGTIAGHEILEELSFIYRPRIITQFCKVQKALGGHSCWYKVPIKTKNNECEILLSFDPICVSTSQSVYFILLCKR